MECNICGKEERSECQVICGTCIQKLLKVTRHLDWSLDSDGLEELRMGLKPKSKLEKFEFNFK